MINFYRLYCGQSWKKDYEEDTGRKTGEEDRKRKQREGV